MSVSTVSGKRKRPCYGWRASNVGSVEGRRLMLCYGHTLFTPGRYLEDALRARGAEVVRHGDVVPAGAADEGAFDACIWVESPSQPTMQFAQPERLPRPLLAWVHARLVWNPRDRHHVGESLAVMELLRPDLVLMAHSLHLWKRMPAPVASFPFGWDPEVFPPGRPWREREIDVAFIGSGLKSRRPGYERRRAIFAIVEDMIPPARRVIRKGLYREEIAELYGNSKVVINTLHDVVSAINMRLWEAMGCGALVLTEEARGHRHLFSRGTHYIPFSGPKQLRNRLRWALDHPDESASIAQQGHQWVDQAHRYAHRVDLLTQWIDSLQRRSL